MIAHTANLQLTYVNFVILGRRTYNNEENIAWRNNNNNNHDNDNYDNRNNNHNNNNGGGQDEECRLCFSPRFEFKGVCP